MKWTLQRTGTDASVLTIIMDRREANEVCKELNTGDDSPEASKLTFSAFMSAADGRGDNWSDK